MWVSATNNVVPIALARARQKVVNHFCALHAIAPEDAIEFVPQTPLERRQFDMMLSAGVIRQREPGAYWIDLSRHDAATERRRKRVIPFVLAATLILVWIVMLYYRG